MDFISSLGAPFLAHRLKRTSELLLEGTSQLVREHGGAAPIRSVSMILLLREQGPLSITEIAYRLRLSHPFIIQLSAALAEIGYVRIEVDQGDKRRKIVSLTRAGRKQAATFDRLSALLEAVFQELFLETGTDLISALDRFEDALERLPLAKRIERTSRSDRQASSQASPGQSRIKAIQPPDPLGPE